MGAKRNHGGNIRQLPSGRWQVRIYEPKSRRYIPTGMTYRTKKEANAVLSAAVADRARGKWVDPSRSKVTVGPYVERWIADNVSLAPRTRDLYTGLLRRHIAPHLGQVALGDLTRERVRRWHAHVHTHTSATQAAKGYRLLRAALATAVEDGMLPASPCTLKGAGIEPERDRQRDPLEPTEVAALADAVPERFRALVLLAAWASLRFGELAALTRVDVDLHRGTVTVSKNLQTLEGKRGSVVVNPKSKAGRRTVHVPPPILAAVTDHLERFVCPQPDALLFTTEARGAALNRHGWNAVWREARAKVGLTDVRFHDLRHTGNHRAAIAGASTRELMSRMGHSSLRAALIYQKATESRDAAIAKAMGDAIDPA